MWRPYSDVSRDRSSELDGRLVLREHFAARSAISRKIFDISPGQVCSERDEPLISRMRLGPAASSCWRAAVVIASERRSSRAPVRNPDRRIRCLLCGFAALYAN